jgi:quercetin dioxygenase-like cupin family protein
MRKTALAKEDWIKTMNKAIGTGADMVPRPAISAPDGDRNVPMGALAPGTAGRLLAASADTSGVVTVMETVKEPGDVGPPRHRHSATETFYVLEGEMTFLVGEEVIRAARGTCLVVPGGLVHTMRNTGGTLARLLTVFVPGGLEGYFEAVSRLNPATDPATRAALDRAWEVEIVGPPLGDEDARRPQASSSGVSDTTSWDL